MTIINNASVPAPGPLGYCAKHLARATRAPTTSLVDGTSSCDRCTVEQYVTADNAEQRCTISPWPRGSRPAATRDNRRCRESPRDERRAVRPRVDLSRESPGQCAARLAHVQHAHGSPHSGVGPVQTVTVGPVEVDTATLKYAPVFPDRFGCLADARAFCEAFFSYYNHEHRHSGIGLHTPPRCTTAPPPKSEPSGPPPSRPPTRPTPPASGTAVPSRRSCPPQRGSTSPARRPSSRATKTILSHAA